MHTTTLILREQPSLADFRAFIESLPGGGWAGAIGIPRGVVEAERGHVYVDYDDKYGHYFDNYLDEQRKADLLAQIGQSPQFAIHVQASVVDVGSRELADHLCKMLLAKWGGTIE
jgi:hypothetical protein